MKIFGLYKHQCLLSVMIFVLCVIGAWNINGEGYPNGCPDEWARQLVTNFIYENNKLPLGNEEEIIIGTYGFSYALRPYLTSIIGAGFMKLASLIGKSDHIVLFSSRLCSVFSITICFIFACKLGNVLFSRAGSRTLFGVVTCFLPQVMFLGMYQNNDIFALMSIVVTLYFLVQSYKNNWKDVYCVGLSIGISLSLQSYYSIYGWIIGVGGAIILLLYKDERMMVKEKLKALSIIVGIVIISAGWFFIRNALLHDGDFFGMLTEGRLRQNLMDQGVKVFQLNTPSKLEDASFLKFISDNDYFWLRSTLNSFIGMFAYMSIPLSDTLYNVYYTLFVIGIVSYVLTSILRKDRANIYMFMFLLISSLITLGLSMYHSYFRDNQPQGRYVISIILLLAYMISYSIDNISVIILGKSGNSYSKHMNQLFFGVLCSIVWIILFGIAYMNYISLMFT